MASKTIDIAVNVKDVASQPMKKVENQMCRTGKAAKKTRADFIQFNRVMFSTTAFVGLFTVAMSRLTTSMMEAARLDRVVSEYEKTVGPKGELIMMIRQMTDTSIDFFEAMKSGIALKSLGIATSTKQIAELVSRAGVAAKMAGKDSAEGVKTFTQFLKDGSLAHLENLNLIERTNFGLKVQQSILGRYGGVAGGALSAAQRLAIGLDLLRKKTEGSMKGQRDYLDVLQDLQLFSKLAGQEVKTLALAAFAPLLDRVKDVMFAVANFAERVRKTDKEILFLIKTIGIATTAVSGLFAAFGTLILATNALGAVGIGLPGLITILGTLGATFIGVTHGADGLMNRLKVFGAIFQGTFQLVKSFITVPENFAKGIGYIDTEIADLLRKHGLLDLVTQISRVTASITMFSKGVFSGFRDGVQFIIDKVGAVSKKFLELIGVDPGAWSRFWVEGIENIGKSVGKLAVGILAVVTTMKSLSFFKGLFSKIPIVGKLFGGGRGSGRGPSGTVADPVHVSLSDRTYSFLDKIFTRDRRLLQAGIGNLAKGLSMRGPLDTRGALVGRGFAHLGTLARRLATRFAVFALLAGAAQGVYQNFDKVRNIAGTLYDVIKIKVVGSLAFLGDKFAQFGTFIGNAMTAISDLILKIPVAGPAIMATLSAAGDLLTSPIESVAKVTGQAIGAADRFATEQGRKGLLAGETARSLMQGQMPMMLDTGATPEARLTQLQATQEKLKGEQQMRFTEAMIQAQDRLSESGKVITAEEYEKIMRHTLGEAVQFLEKPLSRTAENTTKSEATATAKRGC